MTAPRQVLPGTTYLVTRRCAQRELLLRPSELTNAIFLYVLGLAARRYAIQVHAFCVLGNHFHVIVTDPFARLPAFAQYLGSLVARAMNASLGRWESFWAPSSYSAVALCGPEDIVAKAAYVLANPAAAGLVRRGSEWPGLWSGTQIRAWTAERPVGFFRANGTLPGTVELALVTPPGFASAEDFEQQLVPAVAALEREAAARRATDGRGFLGAERVLAQRTWRRPRRTEARRGLNPRIAGLDKWKRIEALTRLKDFLRAYRLAYAAWRSGVSGVVFPAGTYLLRVAHGVPCATVG